MILVIASILSVMFSLNVSPLWFVPYRLKFEDLGTLVYFYFDEAGIVESRAKALRCEGCFVRVVRLIAAFNFETPTVDNVAGRDGTARRYVEGVVYVASTIAHESNRGEDVRNANLDETARLENVEHAAEDLSHVVMVVVFEVVSAEDGVEGCALDLGRHVESVAAYIGENTWIDVEN